MRVIGTLQTSREPRQAPVQDRSRQPAAGFAVSRTGAYEGNEAAQRGLHVSPGRELRTVPRPLMRTDSR